MASSSPPASGPTVSFDDEDEQVETVKYSKRKSVLLTRLQLQAPSTPAVLPLSSQIKVRPANWQESSWKEKLKIWWGQFALKPHNALAGRKQFHMIHPNSSFVLFWAAVQAIFLFFIAFTIPIRIAFDGADYCAIGTAWATVDVIVDTFFIVDLALQFFMCRKINGVISDKKREVVLDYMKKDLIIDIIKCIPVSYVQVPLWLSDTCDTSLSALQLMKILRGLRLLRLARLFNVHRIRNALAVSHSVISNPNAFRLFRLCFLMMLCCHFAACAWWFVKKQADDLHDFEEAQNLPEQDTSRYLLSLYFAVSTLTTTGYGDIRGTNDQERLVALFCMIFGGFLFASIVSSLSSLSLSLGAAENALEMKKTQAIQFLQNRKVSLDLQKRVNESYDHFRSNTTLFPEEMIDELPNSLRHEVLLQIATETLTKVHIFRECEPAFLLAIYPRLVPMRCAPGEVLTKEGAMGSEMYFILTGSVLVMVENGTKVVGELGEGDVLGEMAVLTGGRRNATCVTKDFCELYLLDKPSLEEVLEDFPGIRNQLRLRAVQMSKIRNKLSSTLRFVATQKKISNRAPKPEESDVIKPEEDEMSPVPRPRSRSMSVSSAKGDESAGAEKGEIEMGNLSSRKKFASMGSVVSASEAAELNATNNTNNTNTNINHGGSNLSSSVTPRVNFVQVRLPSEGTGGAEPSEMETSDSSAGGVGGSCSSASSSTNNTHMHNGNVIHLTPLIGGKSNRIHPLPLLPGAVATKNEADSVAAPGENGDENEHNNRAEDGEESGKSHPSAFTSPIPKHPHSSSSRGEAGIPPLPPPFSPPSSGDSPYVTSASMSRPTSSRTSPHLRKNASDLDDESDHARRQGTFSTRDTKKLASIARRLHVLSRGLSSNEDVHKLLAAGATLGGSGEAASSFLQVSFDEMQDLVNTLSRLADDVAGLAK